MRAARRRPSAVRRTSSLLSSCGRERQRVARVERAGQDAPAPHAGSCSQRACSSSRARAFTSCSATDAGPGPARRGAPQHRRARLEQRERLGPEVGVGQHQLVERHAALRRLAHERADDGRAPRGTARPARTSHSARSTAADVLAVGRRLHARRHRPRRWRAARRSRRAPAGTGRARRTAAPCPPGGRGCTRAGGPSAWRGSR